MADAIRTQAELDAAAPMETLVLCPAERLDLLHLIGQSFKCERTVRRVVVRGESGPQPCDGCKGKRIRALYAEPAICWECRTAKGISTGTRPPRPLDPAIVEDIRRQCQAAGVECVVEGE